MRIGTIRSSMYQPTKESRNSSGEHPIFIAYRSRSRSLTAVISPDNQSTLDARGVALWALKSPTLRGWGGIGELYPLLAPQRGPNSLRYPRASLAGRRVHVHCHRGRSAARRCGHAPQMAWKTNLGHGECRGNNPKPRAFWILAAGALARRAR